MRYAWQRPTWSWTTRVPRTNSWDAGRPALEVPAGTVCGEPVQAPPRTARGRARAGTRQPGLAGTGRAADRAPAGGRRRGHPGPGPRRFHCRPRTRREGRARPPARRGGPGRRGADRPAAGRRRFSQLARGFLHNPKPSHPDPADWWKRLHGNADPGRAVNLHVRAVGSPGWRFALCFRDWLRDDEAARADYLAQKRRVARLHGVDKSTAGYAADKEGWFTDYAAPRMDAWARRTGWRPPS